MKIYLNYEDIPKNNVYLGSDNFDGSIYEEIQNFIDDSVEPVKLKDENGFYHYFDLGV